MQAEGKQEGAGLQLSRLGRNGYHLQQDAAVELFLRLGRARQTLDFTKRQVGALGEWDAIQGNTRAAIRGMTAVVVCG